MGLSKSKSKSTTNQTATVAPNAAYSPYIDSAAATFKPAYEAAVANNATLMPRVNSVLDFYGDTLAGKNLNGNPYLDGIISKSNDDITNRVSGQFSSAGRYGSNAYSGALSRALAENENNLRFNNYAMERGLQNSAGQAILSGTGVAAALPQAAAGAYADQIRALLGQYTTGTQNGTTTQTQSGGLLGSLLGVAGAGLGGWASGGFKGI